MNALAEAWEPFRAALEGASVLPGRYVNVVWAALAVDVGVVGLASVLWRARGGDGERRVLELLRWGGYAAGATLVSLGALAGPWGLARRISRDGHLSATTSLALGLIAAFLVVAGVVVTLRSARAPALAVAARRLTVRARRWLEPGRRGRDWTIGLGLTAALLLNVEAALYVYRVATAGPVRRTEVRGLDGAPFSAFWRARGALGYGPPADTAVQVHASLGDRTIYRVRYTIGPHRGRVTPATGEGEAGAVAFFGGSFTFGEGVEDDETLPARVAARLPAYRAVNFGFSGYGPQHMLALLESGEVAAAAEAPVRAAVYTFIDGHVNRAIGSYGIVSAYGASFPYYDLDDRGRLRSYGSFASGRPWRAAWYGLMRRSEIVGSFDLEIPRRPGERHFRLTAEILAAAARRLREDHDAPLLVVLYPGTRVGPELAPLLAARGVQVLDYSGLFDPAVAGYSIPGDGHPSPRAYAEVGERLAADLEARLDRVGPGRLD